jgi:hypothetical protein
MTAIHSLKKPFSNFIALLIGAICLLFTVVISPNASAIAPPSQSLVVTSLLDDGSTGTLRWAITQANANAGGIYDAITFSVDGSITLLSALPQITQSLTVAGNGRTNTVIGGNNLYRPFYVASGQTLTIYDLTLKSGQSTNGGLIYNSGGTVSATNVRFTAMSGGSAVFNNSNGNIATYSDSTFDYLSIGIAGDYGSTPALSAGETTWANTADTVFTNRTYVNNVIFDRNSSGIYNYRFTKIDNSTFSNNTSYGANVTGLNRTQIRNSTFVNNGVGIYHSVWMPPSFVMGTDNRIISGNTFTNNGQSIYLDDGYNTNRRYQGWATLSQNSWDNNGRFITYTSWNGTANVTGYALPDTQGMEWISTSNTTVTTTTTTSTTVAPTTTTTTSTTVAPTTTTSTSTTVAPTTTTSTSTTVAIATTPVVTVAQGQASVATIAPRVGPTTTVLDPMRLQAPQTTTTTVQPVVKNAALPPTAVAAVAPVAPALAPGKAGAVIGGKTVAATVSRASNQITAIAGEITTTVSGLTSDGQRVALNSEGNLIVNKGDKLVVDAAGFAPDSEVEVWMYSTPTQLGVVTADAGGKVSGTFALSDGLEVGDHRVVLSGENLGGAEALVGLGLTYGAVESGSSITRVLIAIPIALAILFGLFLPAVTRRRRQNSAVA